MKAAAVIGQRILHFLCVHAELDGEVGRVVDAEVPPSRLKELLAEIRENIGPRDWLDNLFYGTVSWALGERKAGMTAVRNNVLFEAETQISPVVLASMESGDFDMTHFRREFWRVLANVNAPAETLDLLTAWFNHEDGAARRMAMELRRLHPDAPVPKTEQEITVKY